MLKSLARNLGYGVIARSRIPQVLHKFGFPNKLTIVTYHAVVRAPLSIYDWCFLDENSFRRQLIYLKNHFDVLPLSAAVEALQGGKIEGRSAVITFDDGYQNNYTVAFPILRELGLPATIFLTTGWIDTGNTLRYLRLNLALAETKKETLAWNGRMLDLREIRARNAANVLIRHEIRALPQADRMQRLRQVIRELDDDPERPMTPESPFRMLSSSAIKDMGQSGLIEFGAHTHTHPVLSGLSPDECRKEIELSIKNVQELTGRCCNEFAYPFGGRGDYGRETVELLRSAGVRVAVTTIPGFNDNNTSPLELRRYSAGPNEDMAAFQLKVHHLRTWCSRVNDH
jgi:peptidoglycan/xylan/chitin deacetylase (PgdA/CDA1 family)